MTAPREFIACLLVASLGVAGCATPNDEEAASGQAQTSADLSYVGKAVVDRLEGRPELKALQGKTWDVTQGNALDPSWLLPTMGSSWWGPRLASIPSETGCAEGEPNCDADFLMRRCETAACPSGTCEDFAPAMRSDHDTPAKMCVGYADWFEREIYETIVSAKRYVDITSLWLPAGRFAAAVRNGLTRLAARGDAVTVRILSGNVKDIGPLAWRATSASLRELTRDLPKEHRLKIYVSEHSAALLSWNHSKLVAADGKRALVGGHNMHTDVYQLANPVEDLSMRLRGPAAADAQRYANEVWRVACERGPLNGIGLVSTPPDLPCPDAFEPRALDPVGDVSIISAGRLGAEKINASDDALLAMVDAAKESVVMSQEDLLGGRLPKTPFAFAPDPVALFDRLGAAMARGVDVYLVMSNVTGELFTKGYSHGWTPEETAVQMADRIVSQPALFPKGADIVGTLCQKLHVAGLRLADAKTWPDGTVFANHSKFLMIDTQALYVGSQNLYMSDLAEFGYIVDSASAARLARTTFWEPLWNYSKASAASGSGVAKCPFRH